jgi:predicted dehydrogenase
MDRSSLQISSDARGEIFMQPQEKRTIPRVGVVGAGGFGCRHASILATLAREGLCELVAACDPHLDSLPAAWSQKPLDQVRIFRNHEQMFQAGALDYIVIASPPHWHEIHCLHALETGAYIYLEKPPVPTYSQLLNLLGRPGADRVAVGFQMLEAKAIQDLKRKLVEGKLGTIREIWASGLWPRTASYYRRADWAGKMSLAERPVFDGPLTNALAHLVQNVFFLAGNETANCALPRTAAGYFARAQPIESYDFGWIKGTMENGISYNILAGHCSRTAIPWKVSVRTDRGIYSIEEKDLHLADDALLVESHRSFLAARQRGLRITSGLSDCLGYSMATSSAWLSSVGVDDIPFGEVTRHGTGADLIYHVESIYRLTENLQSSRPLPSLHPAWIKMGRGANCHEVLASPTATFR